MAELAGSTTEQNLRLALAREAETSRRYLYFAQQADVEGRPEAAALFRSAAESETGHALGHLDFLADLPDPMTGVEQGETDDHLTIAAATERDEADRFYPGIAATARAEGLTEIADWLDQLVEAEGQLADRFRAAVDDH
ncbi:MAG: rubrerythrin family protein [Actinomycetota bacterium]